MAFRKNENQQLSIYDQLYGLSERKLKVLQGSWAEEFANYIFPNLVEEPFSVLYKDNDASKPNTPVNIILGLLILKEEFKLTDEEVMQQLIFNFQFQYALHTSSFTEQPINDNTLRRFRNRVNAYEEQTGIDLIKGAFRTLADRLANIMNMNLSLNRIDSAMVASSCRRLSRLNIFNETLKVTAKQLDKDGEGSPLTEKYTDDNATGDVGYRLKSEDIPSKMEEMLHDAVSLLELYPEELRKSDSYTALSRLVADQSKIVDGERVLKTGKEISPDSMQTPHEPDATYRKKAGKSNVGFVANVVEACDGENNLITNYDLQKNTYSDAQFLKDVLDEMPDSGGEVDTIIVDGAYASTDTLDIAEAKNIEIVTSSLIGGMQGDFEAQFEIDNDGKITKCPAGHSPIDSNRGEKGYQAHFSDEICSNCPHCDRCPGVFQKKTALIKFSDTALEKAKYAQHLGTEKYRTLSNKRNGIEGVNSVLRRKFNIDKMQDKGLVRKRQRLGIKMMAVNFGRLRNWKRALESSFNDTLQNVQHGYGSLAAIIV